MWFYKTEKGTFWIRFVPRGRGVFVLGMGDRELGYYSSAEAAVDDVYLGKTGIPEWDHQNTMYAPGDLSEWTRVDCATWDSSERSE